LLVMRVVCFYKHYYYDIIYDKLDDEDLVWGPLLVGKAFNSYYYCNGLTSVFHIAIYCYNIKLMMGYYFTPLSLYIYRCLVGRVKHIYQCLTDFYRKERL